MSLLSHRLGVVVGCQLLFVLNLPSVLSSQACLEIVSGLESKLYHFRVCNLETLTEPLRASIVKLQKRKKKMVMIMIVTIQQCYYGDEIFFSYF